jgi:2-polyprenyl-3-methyl-5-hydroxy-6-metoxy-1,4-benzoquinol methylase
MTLRDTRERALPAPQSQTLEDYLVYLKHLALYKFVSSYTARKRVLDLGCGEGYGSDALAHTARFVVAADRDSAAVVHARQKYARANLAFVVCDAQALPFRAGSFETVVSFEVIEHIPNARQYLEEIKRVNVMAGSAIISTPNRLLRLLPFQKPWNRYHLREYAARDLAHAIGAVFPRVQMCGITATPTVLAIEKRRVRQNPIVAYPKMLAQMLLSNGAYVWLQQIGTRAHNPVAARAEVFDVAKFAVDDFQVSADRLRECINLLAVCEK